MRPMSLALSILVLLALTGCGGKQNSPESAKSAGGAPGASQVQVAGAMMNVMHKGELFGAIALDTIAPKEHLFGLGPVEYLTGEILIFDGTSYVSQVVAADSVAVAESFRLKAPFFVYARVPAWREVPLPDSVRTIPTLENYLDGITKDAARPFAFRLSGAFDSATVHVVNLPKGAEVHSPEDAHKNEARYSLRGRTADLVGFFSTQHQGIFTHHDTYVHIHLLTADRKMMGHLDEIVFRKNGMKLWLPA